MNIFPYHTETEEQIKCILRDFRLAMNGISSDRMTEHGILYKKNYGISLPTIKKMAAKYTKNTLLAERLWAMQIRESMIMATLLYPLEKFSSQNAQEWSEYIQTSELCEQFAFNLMQHTSFAKNKALEWIKSNNEYQASIGYLTISRTTEEYTADETTNITAQITLDSTSAKLDLYHAMSVSLRFLSRKNKIIAENILNKISTFEFSNIHAQNYIYQEVKQEIDFLYT